MRGGGAVASARRRASEMRARRATNQTQTRNRAIALIRNGRIIVV